GGIGMSDVDYRLPVAAIGDLLGMLSHEAAGPGRAMASPIIRTEAEYASDLKEHDPDDMDQMGTLSPFVCPACQGALWEVDSGGIPHYRCHVGHSFSSGSLNITQGEAVEQALYGALRALEEKARMLRRLSERLQHTPETTTVRSFLEKAQTAEDSARTIQKLLASGKH